MIKVKDGYAKLIGTTYQGSATQVLLSNGGDLEYSASSKASTLVQRNASQHIYATYFNSAISDEALTDIGSVYVRNTSDTFIRRVSKTQFYSILDDKFVTLDTTQSITGAKTFSTSVRFTNNASIIQNQNDASNYTTILKWYKNGASRNTHDPSIGQHNTGGDGNGSICILPYPTETSPWGGMVGLFISKGVLKLDGKSVALAENYYTKTESDERYVNVTGDTMTGPLIVKAAITGTQLISTIATGTSPLKVTSTTVVTNLNSDLLDGLHETSFFRARGDQSIASSVPTTTELATSNNLCGSWNVKYTGASGHLVQFNAGSGSTRYMQFYSTYSGSLYWRNSTDSTLNTKSWKTIVDSANYTGIVLKIGTATKGSATLPIYLNAGTPTACSTTLGVSITGNAATATKLQTARTINGTSFDGTTNIVTAYWGTARTISLSGAVTGSASVNGSQNVTITTTYQFGSIDGRYVGGNKTANHGSSGTAYTADTYSSTFVNKAFVAFAERGSWAYANNGYVSTDTGVNIPLAGTAIFQWGASDTNKTQLYITPHNNSGVSNPAANEMLFYTSNGSDFTSAWTRVLTHRNYTNYTVTKTGGGASGTWGISITGNAATATTAQYLASNSRMDYGWNGLNYFNINGTAGTAVKANNTPTTAWWHILRFNYANSSGYYTDLAVPFNANSLYYKRVAAGALQNGKWVKVLDELNYTGTLDSRYVTLTTNQTVSGIKTFSTQQKFTVATGTSPFTVSSTTVVGNLNADMVDGYHSSKLFRSFGGVSIDFNFSDDNNNNGLYYLHSNYTQSNKNGITYGSLMNFSSSASSWQIISGNDARLYYRNRWWSGGGGAWSAWKTIAYTSDIKDPANYYWANVEVSASSNSGTSPTFNTCYTSNWFRSTGNTGWYSESYGGGWYMTDSTWIRTCGNKSVYQNTGQIRTDGYLVTNGGITVGATSQNNGTYKSHVTGNSWSSGYIRAGAGFYHNSVNSNSYVLLAGGSYKSLADFAKGNAGASNRGVYVTNGTVTAMTYYLNATVNSGASGKLAYYSGTNSIDDYTNTIGSSSTPIYINNGIPNAANSYRVVNSGHYFSAFGISGYIYVIRYGQVVCVSINMSSGGDGSTGTTTLLTNLPSAVYTTGQSASKGGGSALRQATFYVSGTTLYVYSNQANQLPNKVSFTYITNTLE